jgi:hypothetical protein
MQAGTSYIASTPPLDISPPSLLFLLLELVLPSSLVVFSPCSCSVCSAEILACVWVQSPSRGSPPQALGQHDHHRCPGKDLTDSSTTSNFPSSTCTYRAALLPFRERGRQQLLNLSFSSRRLFFLLQQQSCIIVSSALRLRLRLAPASALQLMTSRAAILFLLELSSSASSSASLPQSSLLAAAPR